MEKYIIFIGQKIRNCYNINSPSTDVQSQCNLCQILTGFCVEIDKLIPRFTGKRKGSKVISTILKSERLTLPDFKTFIKLQQPTQSCTDIKIDKQINGIEKKIQTHTHIYGQLTLQRQFNAERKSVFQIVLEQLNISMLVTQGREIKKRRQKSHILI